MGSYLEQYFDAGRVPDEEWSLEEETLNQAKRLADEAAIGYHAHEHKRRLGAEATARQLARDKIYAKRTMYGAESLINAWGVTPKQVTDLVNKALRSKVNKEKAAQVDWTEHLQSKIVSLRDDQHRIATNGKHHDLIKEANKALLRLDNEIASSADRYQRVFGNPIST